jgi:hypothetical protein
MVDEYFDMTDFKINEDYELKNIEILLTEYFLEKKLINISSDIRTRQSKRTPDATITPR